jgi:hypothetical protein
VLSELWTAITNSAQFALYFLDVSGRRSHSEDVDANNIKMRLDEWDMENITDWWYSG